MEAEQFMTQILTPLGVAPDNVAFAGEGELESIFAVSGLAAGSTGAAARAIAGLIAAAGGGMPAVTLDRRRASLWFDSTLRPIGWEIPAGWDPIAGDYAAADGWIRLHTNAPHHRAAALSVLGVPAEKPAVTAAVAHWRADDLESAVVQQGGCAAAMRGLSDWAAHPNGAAVAAEPPVAVEDADRSGTSGWRPAPGRPLAGIRVLDLTRVLAGPVATRFLAGFGADVLRIDPPSWNEPGVLPGVTLGKRCARLDLKKPGDRRIFDGLLSGADILVHGYRSDALARLGLDNATRRGLRPGLIDVCLDAYGWTGPWLGRRGFDSLVQMSSGIAAEGMRRYGTDRPKPLPVQALDHAAGHILAAAAVRGLTHRLETGMGSTARTSLARVAALLAGAPIRERSGGFAPVDMADFDDAVEQTGWGPGRRLRPPVSVEGAPMRWDRPAGPLGTSEPVWLAR